MTRPAPLRAWLCLTLALALAACPKPAEDEGTGDTDTTADADTDSGVADPFVDFCDPSAADACGQFAEPHLCCSFDPTALLLEDLQATVLPKYIGRGGVGVPLFSGGNNPLSRRGSCVLAGSVPVSAALADINAQGCPVPCNPRWSSSDVSEICGAGAACCQVPQLEAKDCVLDSTLGDAGCWRPVTGSDIIGLGGIDATDWGSNDHATHQDPSGESCKVFADNVPADVLANFGLSIQDVLIACYRRLSVADQHGFCLNLPGGGICPEADPAFIDACEQLNLDDARAGCN